MRLSDIVEDREQRRELAAASITEQLDDEDLT